MSHIYEYLRSQRFHNYEEKKKQKQKTVKASGGVWISPSQRLTSIFVTLLQKSTSQIMQLGQCETFRIQPVGDTLY